MRFLLTILVALVCPLANAATSLTASFQAWTNSQARADALFFAVTGDSTALHYDQYSAGTGPTWVASGDQNANLANVIRIQSTNQIWGTNHAVNGAPMATIELTSLGSLYYRPKYLLVRGGINNVQLGDTFATVKANWDNIQIGCMRSNCTLIASEIWPSSLGNATTRTNYNIALRSWCAASNVFLLSAHDWMADPTDATELNPAWDLPSPDSIHVGTNGTARDAQIWLGKIRAIEGLDHTYGSFDTSFMSVQAALIAATNTDTVRLPAGTGNWGTQLAINKGIYLKGTNSGATIIRDDIAGNTSLIAVTLTPFYSNRISGIQFAQGTRTSYGNTRGTIYVTGYDTNINRMRIDHCIFTNLTAQAIEWQTALGVLDRVTNYFAVSAGMGYVKGSSWGGGTNGDGSWYAADLLGTENAVYFEYCHFEYLGTMIHAGALDAQAGGRYVVRHTTLIKCDLHGHGVESGQRERSTRTVEAYFNNFQGIDVGQQTCYIRGGTGVIFSNTISGFQASATPWKLLVFRAGAAWTPFWGATGTNQWDTNYQASAFASGTATGSNDLSLTVAGTPYSPSQYIGYTILRTSDILSSGIQFHGLITANTANTITWQTSGVGAELRVAIGDTFSIYRVAHALDQPGRCCDSSFIAADAPSPPANWHQLTSPWYEWGNTREAGADTDFAANHSLIIEGVHFFNDTEKPGYTPYTDPHPLASDDEAPPPGTGAAAIVGPGLPFNP